MKPWVIRNPLLYGIGTTLAVASLLNLLARYLLPNVCDSYPPPSPEMIPWQYAIGIGNLVVSAAIGVLEGFRIHRNNVRQIARNIGILCRNCGYNLTGNVSGACPECGEQI